MNSGVKAIHVRVVVGDQEYLLETSPGEYRSLMALLYDRIYIDCFGDCRGMGRCGTCRVFIDGDPALITGMDRNEASTLAKAGSVGEGVRLSCQVIVDHLLDGRTVRVLGEE